ncbi:MAG: hypothetical protein R3346_00045 [Candidatus Spechtbacterales bacterium]|nr:hypothetical protein [Candidatus Spechtbacterales bacterium]
MVDNQAKDSLWDIDKREYHMNGNWHNEYSGDHILVTEYPDVHNLPLEDVLDNLRARSAHLTEPKVFLWTDADGKASLHIKGWRPMTEKEQDHREELRKIKQMKLEERMQRQEEQERAQRERMGGRS